MAIPLNDFDLALQGIYAGLGTILFAAILLVIVKGTRRATRALLHTPSTRGEGLHYRQVQILSANGVRRLLRGVAVMVAAASALAAAFVYVSAMLRLFPWTRPLGEAMVSFLEWIGMSLVHGSAAVLPDVASMAGIVLATFYSIRLARWGFRLFGNGTLHSAWFHQEWATPTFQIVRVLILTMAAIAIIPHIPGHDSRSFEGVTIFLGAVVSLASSSTVSNVVSGIVLTYMRAYKVGDRVEVSKVTGDITERGLLSTHLRTIKNEEITLPNSLVLGNHIVNYSAASRGDGLILHTAVTIGYDIPWKRVHELLIRAAQATPHILADPQPYVLETGLNDFSVTYDLNAYTDQPNRMAIIYARMREKILDQFSEAGIELMSPHFYALRDGNTPALPPRSTGSQS